MQGRLAAVVVLALATSGCMEAPAISTTHFTSSGAFRAALEAGADVEPPRIVGGQAIALRAPDLDAAWVAGQYALTGVQWTPWVPSGPTEVNPEQQWELLSFDLVGKDLVVQHGYSPREVVRAPAHHFLENVTTLTAAERDEVVQRLMNATAMSGGWAEIRADLGLRHEDINATSAWNWAGRLKAMRGPVHDGYHEAGAWYKDSPGAAWRFRFAHASATLERGSLFGDQTRAFVLPTDDVYFTWTTDEPESDERADAALRRMMDRAKIEVPPAHELEWGHGFEEH